MRKDMFHLAVWIRRCLLTLLWLREAEGATFFYQYKTENVTQNCNQFLGANSTAWWFGHQKSSLQIFQQGFCTQKKSQCENCHNGLHLSNFSSGGIFACRSLMGCPILENKIPVFTSKDDCMNFNFFIIAIINSPAEQSSENIHGKSEENVSIEEEENFTLSCEFELTKNTTTFVVYWFKETEPSPCLFSASNEGSFTSFNFSYDVNCCIDEAFRVRRINSSKVSEVQHKKQTHIVTITNSTETDSGSYVCVVAAYNRKYTWTIEHRTSVSVRKASPRSSKFELKISLAATAAATLLMGGIVLFLCCKKKGKGKPLKGQQRDQTMDAAGDCSPYAVSSRNALPAAETVYLLVTNPGESPSSAASSFPQGNSGTQQGGDVQALYSKVLKDKGGPSLASESSI